MAIISGVVRDAVARGDLELPDDRTPEDIVFGLWSINIGAFAILSSSDSLQEIGIVNPVAALRENTNQMLDGYGWKPLSTEVDFREVLETVKQELLKSDLINNP